MSDLVKKDYDPNNFDRVVERFFGDFQDEDRKGLGDNFYSVNIPTAQIINKNDPDPNGNFGIAIRKEIADNNGFTLTDGWQEYQHYFSDGASEKMYITKTPRMLILNISEWYKTNGNEIKRSYYTSEPLAKGWHTFRYCVVMFLDEGNNFLSDSPFRFKASKTPGNRFLKKYQSFLDDHYKAFRNITNKNIDKNTYKDYHSNIVFEPEITIGIAESSNGEHKSYIMDTVDYKVPSDIESFGKSVIPSQSEEDSLIKQWIDETREWIALKNVNDEYQLAKEENTTIDAWASEIMPNGNRGMDYQSIDEDEVINMTA